MTKRFAIKFTDLNLDDFLNSVYENYKRRPEDSYIFDLSETEYISNQELLVLTALLKTFIEAEIKFKVYFLKPEVRLASVSERVKKQIIQIWKVWQIYQIVETGDFLSYFDIDGSAVNAAMKELGYTPKNVELYNRYGVTPFISLPYINNYKEKDVQKIIQPIYKLNSVIKAILKNGNCNHPFVSNSLSTIITEELYLNFLDHAGKSSFNAQYPEAFFSISLLDKIDPLKTKEEDIQWRRKLNFDTECLPQTLDFYSDDAGKTFKNIPYLQFSFLDFGQGIPESLRADYIKANGKSGSDLEILLYALRYNTSRHPITDPKHRLNKSIPRGLFDAVTIVKRYKGLAVIRSGLAKVILNYGANAKNENAIVPFGENNQFFAGTLISIYIPATDNNERIDVSTIKYDIEFPTLKPKLKDYISVALLIQKLDFRKENVYNSLIAELRNSIANNQQASVLFLSFAGCDQVDKRILKNLLYFLATDFEINVKNNVVIIDAPPQDVIDEITGEIEELSLAIKNYKFHPLPIVAYDFNRKSVSLNWLGVYQDEDKRKLNDLLYDEFSIAISDFSEPYNVIGHINYFDEHGNLRTNLPTHNQIEQAYFKYNKALISKEVEEFLITNGCIKHASDNEYFLCNGNYYQQSFIDLSNLINDPANCDLISYFLFQYIKGTIDDDDIIYLGISASSQRILTSLENQQKISKNDYIAIDEEENIDVLFKSTSISTNKKYVLVCDVLSTGYLAIGVQKKLAEFGAQLDLVAVIVNTMSSAFQKSKSFVDTFGNKVVALHNHEIKKIVREEIPNFQENHIIRINSHTNIPITLSIATTNYYESIIYQTEIAFKKETGEIILNNSFLNEIDPGNIRIGYLKYNNVIHPYFFKTYDILKNIDEQKISEIFKKINNANLKNSKIQVFYPRKSGIEGFDIDVLKKVLSNHAIDSTPIERFVTADGWRFPHNSDYLNIKAKDHVCFILDDGSCSGDSLIQMIDEIAFYQAQEIILLCFIGRLSDHKRELFSRLSKIKSGPGTVVNISIYFVTHWHIPTIFPDENPNIRESNRLRDLIELQNTPLSIKRIAINIIKEIEPKNEYDFKDYKYLPKLKNGGGIPKKDLMLIRDEIGKIVGYRLYKESFTFFDHFMSKYADNKTWKGKAHERYKEIELLCAAFVYEPYLYEKIKNILPDVIERIEEFVRTLISNPKTYPLLSYDWNKKDIVHLFFIVFRDEKLIEQLTEDFFRNLIHFTTPKETSLNYVLYKLLWYFPIKASELESKKFGDQVMNLLTKLKDQPEMKEVRKYYNYVRTLPSKEDFYSQFEKIKHNYELQEEKQIHDRRRSFNHNISELLAAIRESVIDIKDTGKIVPSNITVISTTWFEILDFLIPILSFSSSFKDFFAIYPYYRFSRKIAGDNSDLRNMVGTIESVIFSLNEQYVDIEKLNLVDRLIVRIQVDIGIGSLFHQLIKEPNSDAEQFLTSLSSEIQDNFQKCNIQLVQIRKGARFKIPQEYLNNLVKNEIVTNSIKYADKSKTIQILSSVQEDRLELVINNSIGSNTQKGSTAEGLKCLRLLSEFKILGFKYRSKIDGDKFIQYLTFLLH